MADDKGASPIPRVKNDDPEDVSWALQTAETMWGRGDRVEALKWIRRAAEAASEAEADDRALELAKRAADLTAELGPVLTSQPPPPAAPPQRPMTSRPPPPVARPSATISASPPAVRTPSAAPSRPPPPVASRPPPAPANKPQSIPPRPPAPTNTPSVRPAAGRPPTPSTAPRAPMAAARPAPAPALKPAAPQTAGPPSRRGRRASSANLNDEARRARDLPKEVTVTVTKQSADPEVTQQIEMPVAPPLEAPAPKRRGRASKPSIDPKVVQAALAAAPPPAAAPAPPPPSPSAPATPPAPQVAAPPATTDEMDAWPTQSLTGDELDSPADERTRIGAAAYVDEAKRAAVAPVPAQVPTSQAMRVVVWRAADGVHVAPYGTMVNAITMEAVLVALDPSADLGSWLSRR